MITTTEIADMESYAQQAAAEMQHLAAEIQTILRAKGYNLVKCRGHFQYGLAGPDTRTVVFKAGDARNVALVKPHAAADVIADLAQEWLDENSLGRSH